jgi:hypothetical protein
MRLGGFQIWNMTREPPPPPPKPERQSAEDNARTKEAKSLVAEHIRALREIMRSLRKLLH